MSLIKDIDSTVRDNEQATIAAAEAAQKAAEETVNRGKTVADYLNDIRNQQHTEK